MTGDEKNLSLFMVLVASLLAFSIFTIPSCVAVNTCLDSNNKNPVLCELVLQNKYPYTERMLDEKHAR
jgi:hypothetical protein